MATDNHYYRTPDLNLPVVRCSSKRQRRTTSSSDATDSSNPPPPIGKLGDDLLVEILIRSFPNPKPACRCKTVCKHWSSLISSPRFNRRFVSHHQITSLLHHLPLMPDNQDNQHELEMLILSLLPPMPNRVGYVLKVLDCFKDLVLCGFLDLDRDRCLGLDHLNREPHRSYLICNPFTKQWIALPLAPKKRVWYYRQNAKLVCEPRISNNLDLGGDQAFVYHEYRFRVVCMYQDVMYCNSLDVFCSEAGEWIGLGDNDNDNDHGIGINWGVVDLCSCNGELFWMPYEKPKRVTVFNPFRLDIPPTCIDHMAWSEDERGVTSVSQGALHVISFHSETEPLRLISWRLEQDRKSWRKQCEWFVKSSPVCCSDGGSKYPFNPFLHPHNPEIIFFLCTGCWSTLFSCNSRMEGEVEIFRKLENSHAFKHLVRVFQPRVSCWMTPIPRYKELRGLYDGSHSLWVQGGSETTPIPRYNELRGLYNGSEATMPSLNICIKTMVDFLDDTVSRTKEDHVALIRHVGLQLMLYGNHLREENRKSKDLAADIEAETTEAANNLDAARRPYESRCLPMKQAP